VAEDVDREIRAHLDLCVEELVREGWDLESARREAGRRFGNERRVRRRCRAIENNHRKKVRRIQMVEGTLQDLRYGARTLLKSPGFTLVAILTLALGIGANTTVFSIVNGVLLKPLPYEDPEELVWVAERTHRGNPSSVSWVNFEDWWAESHSFQGLAAFGQRSTTILGGDHPVFAPVAAVSRDFWSVFRVRPLSGRLSAEENHVYGGAPVAVVSEALAWQALGGEAAVGKSLEVSGIWHEIVGVVPSTLDFPAGTQVWTPAELVPKSQARSSHNWRVVGGAVIRSLQDRLVGDTRTPLYLLLGAAAFVLLVACTNLASTLLARGTTRARELAVRSAIGASHARLVRQFLSEAWLLSALGGIAGIGLSQLALMGVRATAAGSIPRLQYVDLDGRVLLFTVAVTLATAIAFGLFPALRARENDQALTLRSEGRGNEGYKGRIWGATRWCRRIRASRERTWS
jgi:hypothetical protein